MAGLSEQEEFELLSLEREKAMTAPASKDVGLRDLAAPTEIAANLASGAVAGPLSGLAGIAGTLIPGPEGQGARWTRGVGEALTYQPRTALGEKGASILASPFEALHKLGIGAGQFAQDKLGLEPAGATAVQTAVEALPGLALQARAGKSQSPQTAAAQSLNEVKDATYNRCKG